MVIKKKQKTITRTCRKQTTHVSNESTYDYTCLNRFLTYAVLLLPVDQATSSVPSQERKKETAPRASQDHKISQVTTEDGDIFMVTKKDVYVTYPLSTTKSMVVSNGRPW